MTAINVYLTFIGVVLLVIAVSHVHGFLTPRASYYSKVMTGAVFTFSVVIILCVPASIALAWIGNGLWGGGLMLIAMAACLFTAVPPLRGTSNALLSASSASLTKWQTRRRQR